LSFSWFQHLDPVDLRYQSYRQFVLFYAPRCLPSLYCCAVHKARRQFSVETGGGLEWLPSIHPQAG
jgi:hypothetical protein